MAQAKIIGIDGKQIEPYIPPTTEEEFSEDVLNAVKVQTPINELVKQLFDKYKIEKK